MILLNSFFVATYIVFSVYLLVRFPKHGLIWIYVCFMQCWSLISCYYNDFGIFNPELNEYTYTSYATTWLAILYILFNMGYWYSASSAKKLDLNGFKCESNFFLFILFKTVYFFLVVLAIYLLVFLFINGIPVLEGLDRLEIEKTRSEFENKFLAYFFVYAFILGLLRRQQQFGYNDVLFIIYVVYFLSIGHKFSGLLELFLSYLTPIWIRSNFKYNISKFFNLRFMLYAFIALILLLSTVMMHYLNITESQENAYNLLIDRIFAMQGHIWWSVQNHVSLHGFYDEQHWLNEVAAIFYPAGVSPNDTGMKYLMINILGFDVANKIFERGYLFTMAYPAILLASFNLPLVAVMQIIMGCFFYNILDKLSNSIERCYFIRALLIFTVVVPFITVLGSGALSILFTFGVLIKLLLFYFIELMERSRRPL